MKGRQTIGILVHPYGEEKPAGLGRYIFEIAKAMVVQDPENDYIIYLKNKPRVSPELPGTNWRVEILSGNTPLWLGWSFRKAERADVYLFNTPVIPFLLRHGKHVVIALDFAYRYLPSESFRNRLFTMILGWYHGYSMKRADRVIAISEATKKEAMKLHGISEEKITVVYPGFTHICALPAERPDTALPEKFFFFVGVLKERKNPFSAVKAFIEFRKTHPDFSFIIAGKGSGPYYENMVAYVKKHRAEDTVRFIGFISDNELSFLYSHAYALVFPSLFEGGFGLPIVEAMDCGLPIITSGQGPYESMEETTKDAALLVDPLDIASITRAMERMADDKGLRESLIAKGRTRAKEFSWENSARGILNAISTL